MHQSAEKHDAGIPPFPEHSKNEQHAWDVRWRTSQTEERRPSSHGSTTSEDGRSFSWSQDGSIASNSTEDIAVHTGPSVDTKPANTQPLSVPPALQASRKSAIDVLIACRGCVIEQERERLSKARVGTGVWLSFWRSVYEPRLYRALSRLVAEATADINAMFKSVTDRLCVVIAETMDEMAASESKKQIKMHWKKFEQRVRAVTGYRAKAVDERLEELRETVEAIPITVGSDLFQSLKRSIFAVDVTADYEFDDSADRVGASSGSGSARAVEYVRLDPDLVTRPGFSDDFQVAMEQGIIEDLTAAMEDDDAPETAIHHTRFAA